MNFYIKSVKTGLFLSTEENYPFAATNSDKWSTLDKGLVTFPAPGLAFERLKRCSKTSRAKVVLIDKSTIYNVSLEKSKL